MSSRRGDEVEMVSRFLAPLCARDEAARNIALAAARTTVEGWLGGVGSPNNNWETANKGTSTNANYRAQTRDSLDGFFPQSVGEGGGALFARKASFDDRYPTHDCVDGKPKDAEARFSSSADTERRLLTEHVDDDKARRFIRIKGGRAKQFDEDDELDADTKVYGKSPKFDIDFGNRQVPRGCGDDDAERIVFNALDGFLSCDAKAGSPEIELPERKLSAGQIKRPLSLDEDVPWKSNRVAEVVTPGDVGRMLNLGNALDGPRHAQANKYLSMVSLHLPVILRLSVNCPFENVRIKCSEIIQMIEDRGLPVPEPAFDGPSAFVPVSELPKQPTMSRMLHHEPGWKLERKGSALLLRRDSSLHQRRTRVCFRCDVEVREYERDEDYYYNHEDSHNGNTALVGSGSDTDTLAASPLAMCASCLAAICVTVVLPWLLIGG